MDQNAFKLPWLTSQSISYANVYNIFSVLFPHIQIYISNIWYMCTIVDTWHISTFWLSLRPLNDFKRSSQHCLQHHGGRLIASSWMSGHIRFRRAWKEFASWRLRNLPRNQTRFCAWNSFGVPSLLRKSQHKFRNYKIYHWNFWFQNVPNNLVFFRFILYMRQNPIQEIKRQYQSVNI